MKKNILLTVLALAVLAGGVARAEDSDKEVVGMVVSMLGEKDKEMRAMALQQVREGLKGPEATKEFVAALPKLQGEAKVALIGALADRGDATAREAIVALASDKDAAVKDAAILALGSLGTKDDVPLLVKYFAAGDEAEKTAARKSLVKTVAQGSNAAIVAELKNAKPDVKVELIKLLAERRALDSIPAFVAAALDAEPAMRMAGMAGLGQLASAEQIPDMLKAVLKADKGAEREAAEKAVMFVCERIEDPEKRAEPVLAVYEKASPADQLLLLSTVGRVGGKAALKVVEAAIADKNAKKADAGVRALCNWPDASVTPQLLELAEKAPQASQKTLALRAAIRVASLPDKRTAAEKLDLLKKIMKMAKRDEERNLVLKRAAALRSVDALKFVLPYVDQPAYAQQACLSVADLAHDRTLRQANKELFDPALDKVIAISKDPKVVGRAKAYKENKTAPK